MAFSVRGLTRGVLGGVTAYRRGAMQGQAANREQASADQARQRQMEQDKQQALYRQLESDLNLRQQKERESQFAQGASLRNAQLETEKAEAIQRRRPPPAQPYRPMTRDEWLQDKREVGRIGVQNRPPDSSDRPTVGQMNARLAELRNVKDEDGNVSRRPVADVWQDLVDEYGPEVNRLAIARTMRRPGGSSVVRASPGQMAWDNLPAINPRTGARKEDEVGPRPTR